jgi:dTDP-glucose 4,6-dehydratase
MSKKVLVTGADGFIGSHLVEELVKKEYEVRAFVCYNSFNSWGWLDTLPENVKNQIEVVSGDVRDSFCVSNAVRGCDSILHLAALIAIPFSYNAPDAYIQTNVTGTLNILHAAREHEVNNTVCTSTSETYGSAQFVPISEQHPLSAQSPYAASKIAADQMALAFYRSFDLAVSVLRPFNTYGPRQSARAVIPSIIGQVLSGCKTISLGSLSPTRDFTFVRDTARGFIQAMECSKCVGKVTNIGSNFEISIGDTVSLIGDVLNVDIQIITDPKRLRPEKSEVDRLYADVSQARKLFSWDPEYGGLAGFKVGLKETADWFSDQKNLAHYKNQNYNV